MNKDMPKIENPRAHLYLVTDPYTIHDLASYIKARRGRREDGQSIISSIIAIMVTL
jgi:hypothetical protein